jgi:hypothetical protein
MPLCIYCENEANSAEHWLPRSLGTFGPLQVLNDKLCTECNRILGHGIEQEFARVGPEAIHRAGLGIQGRHDAASQSPFYYRAATSQPLRAVVVDAPDAEAGLLWETVPGENGEEEARLLEQIVIRDASGARHAVPLNTAWSADVLRQALRHRGIEGSLVEIYLDADHVERVRPILSQVFPGFSADHFSRSGAGQQVRTLEFENRVGVDYFRAIAKIAFHGALRLGPGLDGKEWEFDVLRRFIRYGDRPTTNPVQMSNQGIVAGLGRGVMLRDWGHVVAVETTYNMVSARLQFFVGPSAIPPTWIVRIGRRPASIAANTGAAYYAHYFDQPAPDGHTGEIVSLDQAPRA